ncbi:MAG: formate dehydrogenase accessory sulfurtransferase FdhD [Nocardioidaceae bacterium]
MSDATRPGPTTARLVHEAVAGTLRRRPDRVITEEPLEIRVGWPGHRATRVAVAMRTPGADFELAAGFLISEGIVRLGDAPRTITYCLDTALTPEQQYNVVTVGLRRTPMRTPAARFTALSSACGVCGTQSLDDVFAADAAPLAVSAVMDPGLLGTLPAALRSAQPVFAKTGAVHAASVFSFAGSLCVVREDVGRHNAVDKVLGARLLGAASYGEQSVLCVSGRIGFDIVTKAVAGRIPVVIGVGGPSSLAVQLADRAGVTVCGFARGSRYVVYTHPGRIAHT